jgi:hypothetical protein
MRKPGLCDCEPTKSAAPVGSEAPRPRPDPNAPNTEWLEYHFPARPDEDAVGEARGCEAFANPVSGGWGGYQAACHACKWLDSKRRADKSVAQADALHRANQTCPWRGEAAGHERAIPASHGPNVVPFCPDCGAAGTHTSACAMCPGDPVLIGNFERAIPATDLRTREAVAVLLARRDDTTYAELDEGRQAWWCGEARDFLSDLVAALGEYTAKTPSGGDEQ